MAAIDQGKNRLIVNIPQSVHSDYNGFSSLFETLNPYLQETSNQYANICTNFRANTWFDANLLPIVYAFVVFGKNEYGITSTYDNQPDCKMHKLMIRNQFAEYCFGLEHRPKVNETVVPFNIFYSGDTYHFGEYIDAELVRYLPRMENRVKKDLSIYIQELFGNAQIHGGCSHVFTCGQRYPQIGKMDFTIVNLGKTIRQNVDEFLTEMNQELPDNSIAWAVEPNHSTKRTNSGGIGLTLMRDFIHFNNGKYQIASGNEFWELNKQEEHSKTFSYPFPGTIVNIEIDQTDKKFYQYALSNEDLF